MTATAGVQEYLEAMFRLSDGTTTAQISTSALAAEMSISPASVSEMLRRLSALGLIDHQPYAGASLTPDGLEQATQVIRYHRLWERFLADVLGMSWAQVHSEACQLEHATSPEVANLLDSFLQHPATCPHGNVMPQLRPDGSPATPGLTGQADRTIPLAEAGHGFRGTIRRVDEEPELLRYCAEHGLVPGAVVGVSISDEFEGLRRVEVLRPEEACAAGPTTTSTIGPRAAAGVHVESLHGDDEATEPS